MFGSLIIGWKAASFFLAVIVFMAINWRVEKQILKKTPISDEEYLYRMASIGDCSAYEMFFVCAEKWKIPRKKVEDDFKNYLLSNKIPYYVRDVARQYKSDLDRYQPPIFRFMQ